MTATELTGFDPGYEQALMALIGASNGRIRIKSGFRSHAEQSGLWAQARQKYGSDDAARQWVAPPGHSNHEKGLAADLEGDIGLAHQLAPQFGLVFPMSWEPWHIEPVHARDGASPDAYTTAPPGEMNPTEDTTLSNTPEFMAASIADALKAGSLTGSIEASGGAPTLEAGVGTEMVGGATGSMTDGGGPIPMSAGGGAYGGVNRTQWANDFLTKLGMPTSGENIRAMEAWMQAESAGGGGKFNPLNTTQGGFENTSNINSVGVKNYQSYDDGLAANVKVINNGLYGPILDALKRGDNAMAVAQGIAATPWGTGGLVQKILGSAR